MRSFQKLVLVLGCLAVVGGTMGCYVDPDEGYLTVSGLIYQADGVTPLPDQSSKLQVAYSDGEGYGNLPDGWNFTADPSGAFSARVSFYNEADDVYGLQFRVLGRIGILIRQELAQLSPSLGAVIVEQIQGSCTLLFESRWFDVPAENFKAMGLDHFEVSGVTVVTSVTPIDLEALRQCQIEVMKRIKGD